MKVIPVPAHCGLLLVIAPGVAGRDMVLEELAVAFPAVPEPEPTVRLVLDRALPIIVLLLVALEEMSAVIQKYKVVLLLKGLENVNVWVPVAGLVIVANRFVVAKVFVVV